MNENEIRQFKMMSLQAANGDLDKAKLIFEWVAGETLNQMLDARQYQLDAIADAQPKRVIELDPPF